MGGELETSADALAEIEATLAVDEVAPDTFTSPNIPMPGLRRLFGGQLLAQVAAVAARSAEGKDIKSLHTTFLAEGRPGTEVTYAARRVRDGRSFATRLIEGSQPGRLLLSALVSCHAPERGLEHHVPPPDVPGPDDLPASAVLGAGGAVEARLVGDQDFLGPDQGEPVLHMWLRARRRLGDDLITHQGVLAHSSDLTLMSTLIRPHPGIRFGDPETLTSAATTHTVWFHRPFRIDEWLLFTQRGPSAYGGRGFATGDWYTADGVLVASCAQEALLRVRDRR
jgi:acyl-CoA thioesterase-2